MRVISGRFRGRRLEAPRSDETRPTADRVRESVFSMLASRRSFDDARVLDLYAGSGALGFEALSRGASFVLFVERDGSALDCIASNAQSLGVADCIERSAQEVVPFLQLAAGRAAEQDGFDFVFADPPYGIGVESLPDLVAPILRPGGFLVVEHDQSTSFADQSKLVTTRRFGRTFVSLFDAA